MKASSLIFNQVSELALFIEHRRALLASPKSALGPKRIDPNKFIISDALYAIFISQALLIPLKFIFGDGLSIWDIPSNQAAARLMQGIASPWLPVIYLFQMRALAWLTEKSIGAGAPVPSAGVRWRDTVLLLHGAFGFWGRTAITSLLALNSYLNTILQQYTLNQPFVRANLNWDNWPWILAFVAPPLALFAVWVIFGILQQFRFYWVLAGLALKRPNAASRAAFSAKIFFLYWLSGFAFLLAGLVGYGSIYLIAASLFQCGHYIRYLCGLEAVGFIPWAELLPDFGL